MRTVATAIRYLRSFDMTPSSAFAPGKSADYLALLHFCRSDNIVDALADLQQLNTIKAAINKLPNNRLPVRSILPLIYRNTKNLGIFEQLEKDAQDFIKRNSMILVAEELAKERWLQGIIQSFQERDIPIILLKGAAFSGYLYNPDAPRVGVDIDFLLKQKDFDKACKALGETMNPVILAKHRLATHRTLFERVFVPKTRSIPLVEAHRGLTNPYIFTINEESLWRASEAHPRYNSDHVRVLSTEDNLLHLAVHAFRDMDFCTHNLIDAHHLISQRGIKEETLYRSASDWGARAALYYLLINTQQIIGTKVQSSLLERLEPCSLKKRAHQRLLQLSAMQADEKSISYRTTQIASQLFIPDHLTSALKFQAHYTATRIMDVVSRKA